MRLTRRDALIAVGGLGLTTTAWLSDFESTDTELSNGDVQTLVALGETLYPSEVSVTAEFVETYVGGQRQLDTDHLAGIVEALENVREASRRQTGRRPTELDPAGRGTVLQSMGVARAYADPDGTEIERVRYYIVNNLLYALYTTPKGGKLVGNPNPPGYPGGTEAYQEGNPNE